MKRVSIKILIVVLLSYFHSASAQSQFVDLSNTETQPFGDDAAPHVLARPWYQNIELYGFGAFWYADSGNDGGHPNPGFIIKEATLYIDAQAWENVSFFAELQLTQLHGYGLPDNELQARTIESYAHLRNVLKKWGDDLLSIKVGRFDLPFGEEYLWQDAIYNPMISQTAAYPWYWDEGILGYGIIKNRFLRNLGWVASITDGTLFPSVEESTSKSYTIKLYANPLSNVYVSASVLKSQDTSSTAFFLSDSPLFPVGRGLSPMPSSLGASPSERIDANLYQFDGIITFSPHFTLDVTYGIGKIDDAVDSFDRGLAWYNFQPRYNYSPQVWLAAKISTIFTDNDDQGYYLTSGFIGGQSPYGFDAHSFSRNALAFGWKFNPHTIFKLEIGSDEYEIIEASTLVTDPNNEDRNYFVAELAISF